MLAGSVLEFDYLFATDLEMRLARLGFDGPGLLGVDGEQFSSIRPHASGNQQAANNAGAGILAAGMQVLDCDDRNLFLEYMPLAGCIGEPAFDKARKRLLSDSFDSHLDPQHLRLLGPANDTGVQPRTHK